MVLRRIRRSIDRFLSILDGEGVALFQCVVYLHLALGGLYCLIVARGVPPAVGLALGPAADAAWMVLCAGALICLAGKWLSAGTHHTRYWVFTTGLLLQAAGDICATGAFWGYVLSTAQTAYWGKAVVAAWVFAGLGNCAALLVLRDIRRFIQAERTVRR